MSKFGNFKNISSVYKLKKTLHKIANVPPTDREGGGPRLALYCCLSSHYDFLRLDFSFPV